MIRFLFKGLIRDRQKSLLPAIVVAAGVSLTVLMVCYLTGVMGDFADFSAKFSNGHVKIMTRAYAENMNQMPTDLSLVNVSEIIADAKADHPEMEWVLRTQFGGLLDAPDENRETRSQGPAIAIAIDMLTPGSKEPERLNLENITASIRVCFPKPLYRCLIRHIDFNMKIPFSFKAFFEFKRFWRFHRGHNCKHLNIRFHLSS